MLESRLPATLKPLAELAYDVRWFWSSECLGLFASIDERLFDECGRNPVVLLLEASPTDLARCAEDREYVARLSRVVKARALDLERPYAAAPPATPEHPIAFFCAEFALHASLPVYAGGLGVLAGDYLKEASDRALPVVGVGLLYRNGYFHQRLDASGWQHEHWTAVRHRHLPIEPVRNRDGSQVIVHVPIVDREVAVCVWRVQVGRVPLFLVDSDLPQNRAVDRFITSQLYVGDRELRLRQYIILGIAGVRALRALNIEPALFHLNEGHAAFAALELLREHMTGQLDRDAAWAKVREQLVFTTHTPVAAGNETYAPDELRRALSGFAKSLPLAWEEVLALGRSGSAASQAFGMTPLALRASRAANGVSRVHGEVARTMWRELYPAAQSVPIGHVTNGVHLPTWTSEPMSALLARHLGEDWQQRAADPELWSRVQAIPDEELWAVRSELRRALVQFVRTRSLEDRLSRGEYLAYAEAAADAFDETLLTIGFARRVATYKRLHLLTHNMARALSLLSSARPIQVVIAGKAHPRDDEAKRIIQVIFGMKAAPVVGSRVAFIEDYDLASAARLVAGCDVWINLPRPPLEASGTSGMKAVLNGGLHLSVLDGWWAEAWNGENGWALQSEPGPDDPIQDARDSERLYDLIEREVVPLFHERDARGIPRAWIRKIKASLCSLAPHFNTARMLRDYCDRQYPHTRS